MQLSAENFVDNAATFLPAVEMLAKLTGLKMLSAVASILRRAVQYPESRQQLIEWLKWAPIFSDAGPGAPDAAAPALPAQFHDLEAELTELRAGINAYGQHPTS